MAIRLVRCSRCRHRFNVAGHPTGAVVHCTFCASLLTVPPQVSASTSARRLKRRRRVRIGAGIAAGVLLSGVVSVLWGGWKPGPHRILPASALSPSAPVAAAPAVSRSSDLLFHVSESSWSNRLRETKERIFREFGNRVELREAPPFLLVVEEGPRFLRADVIDDYASRLERLYRSFEETVGRSVNLPAVRDVLPVILLNSRESYDEYCRKRNRTATPLISGMYEYSRRRTVIYHDPYTPFEVVLHEGAHQLLHHYSRAGRDAVEAFWFREGMGTYFEGFRRDGAGELVVDPKACRSRLPDVKRALQDDTFVSLDRLTKLTIDNFWTWFEEGEADESSRSQQARLYYAESWALVYFLMNADEGRYRPVLDQYLRCELEGEGTRENFERAIRERTGLDLAQFDRAFRDYLSGLE